MQYINFNGQLVAEDQPVITASSPWLQDGLAVVESLRVFNGNMPFLADHVSQLQLSINQLELEPKQHFTSALFEREISKLLKKNDTSNASVRIFIFSEASNLMEKANHEAGYLITTKSLDSEAYEWKQDGLHIDKFTQLHHPRHELASLNTTNNLIKTKASKFAHERGLDDVLIFNTSHRPVIFSNGGLLVYLRNELLFPVYSEGAPPNILREYLLPIANRMNIDHRPAEITIEIIEEADEIMRVDELIGVHFVAKLGSKKYRHDLAFRFHEKINDLVSSF